MRNKQVLLILAIAIVCISAIFLKKFKHAENPSNPRFYTEAELEQFWTNHTRQLIFDILLRGKYPIKQINDRIAEQMNYIKSEFNAIPHIVLTNRYIDGNKMIDMGLLASRKTPTIVIVIPAQIDLYHQLAKTFHDDKRERWKIMYEVAVVTSFVHELDHIVLGHTKTTDRSSIEAEALAWAITTVEAIAPIAEALGDANLGMREKTLLRAWSRSEGNISNRCWMRSIEKLYGNSISN